jgi:hypothetical protein
MACILAGAAQVRRAKPLPQIGRRAFPDPRLRG